MSLNRKLFVCLSIHLLHGIKAHERKIWLNTIRYLSGMNCIKVVNATPTNTQCPKQNNTEKEKKSGDFENICK